MYKVSKLRDEALIQVKARFDPGSNVVPAKILCEIQKNSHSRMTGALTTIHEELWKEE